MTTTLQLVTERQQFRKRKKYCCKQEMAWFKMTTTVRSARPVYNDAGTKKKIEDDMTSFGQQLTNPAGSDVLFRYPYYERMPYA